MCINSGGIDYDTVCDEQRIDGGLTIPELTPLTAHNSAVWPIRVTITMTTSIVEEVMKCGNGTNQPVACVLLTKLLLLVVAVYIRDR